MKNNKVYMVNLLTRFLLGVFLLAITPFSIFHKHESQIVQIADEHCTHKIHVTTQKDNCLICKAHFEKAFTLDESSWVWIPSISTYAFQDFTIEKVTISFPHTQLRGPPSLV